MPRGDKSSYTDKQKREAEHIEKSYEKKGVSKDTAESRAWATVNKQDGGGKKKPVDGKSAAKKSGAKKSATGKMAAKKSATKTPAAKKSGTKKAARK